LIRWRVGKMPDVASIKSALAGVGVRGLEESGTEMAAHKARTVRVR
jgi:hypothetical protein